MKKAKNDDINKNLREDGVLDGFILEKRPTTEAEDLYTFSQSSQISAQCGLIGYLRADMDTNGNGFFSTWNDRRRDLKTDEFKAEFDKVLNDLREEGDILYNRSSLSRYCYSTPQAKMKPDDNYYGLRVDTEKYAYLMRMNPNKGEYNLYCFCYVKNWLNDHLKNAERGIRFIDPNYNELFRIRDGGHIKITYDDGEVSIKTCHYVDDYHLFVGDRACYHICQFAEKMQEIGAKVEPINEDLLQAKIIDFK